MVAETSTSLFARVSFAGAECGLQSRSGLAAESFDSTSLATRFLPTTTPTTATRDDGARARGRRRRILRRRARERFLFFHGDKSNVDYIHLVFEPPRILCIPYMRDAARARAHHASPANRRIARSTRVVHVVHAGTTCFISSGSVCLAMYLRYSPVASDTA